MTEPAVKDSNGTTPGDGDRVHVIKSLKGKSTSLSLKRGRLIQNIRLTANENEIGCNAGQVKGVVLKTCFLKRA